LSTIHKQVLNDKQLELLPLLHKFYKFYLAGGTALALQIGHRKSIDFDLFSKEEIDKNAILKVLDQRKVNQIIVDSIDEFTFVYDGVKLTFLNFPFRIEEFVDLEFVKAVDFLTIAAMKAYALGRRAKWKDYVDIYFIIQKESINSIIHKAEELFGNLFSEKLFRSQLCYFEDIDYSEKVDFVADHEVNDEQVKETLKRIAVTF